jgi:hypothetical protein
MNASSSSSTLNTSSASIQLPSFTRKTNGEAAPSPSTSKPSASKAGASGSSVNGKGASSKAKVPDSDLSDMEDSPPASSTKHRPPAPSKDKKRNPNVIEDSEATDSDLTEVDDDDDDDAVMRDGVHTADTTLASSSGGSAQSSGKKRANAPGTSGKATPTKKKAKLTKKEDGSKAGDTSTTIRGKKTEGAGPNCHAHRIPCEPPGLRCTCKSELALPRSPPC